MRFRTITAPNMEAAMAELRSSLGAGAIILNTESGPHGNIIMRAAVERGPAMAAKEEQDPDQITDGFPRHADQDPVSLIAEALAFHRTPAAITSQLINTAGALETDGPVQLLATALDMHYVFSPLPLLPPRPILLIGPAGAGKTITAAKLAARSLLAGHEAGLVTTDLVRTGGAQQLASLAEVIHAPFHRAADAAALSALLGAGCAPMGCVIDTTGTSPYNLNELKQLKNLVMAVDCDPVLVLPAGGDALEACETVNIFSGLGARGMIVTRLDATRRLGSVLGALEAAAMTLHQVSITPYLANGLAPITPLGLARLLLEDPVEHESFRELELAAQ